MQRFSRNLCGRSYNVIDLFASLGLPTGEEQVRHAACPTWYLFVSFDVVSPWDCTVSCLHQLHLWMISMATSDCQMDFVSHEHSGVPLPQQDTPVTNQFPLELIWAGDQSPVECTHIHVQTHTHTHTQAGVRL